MGNQGKSVRICKTKCACVGWVRIALFIFAIFVASFDSDSRAFGSMPEDQSYTIPLEKIRYAKGIRDWRFTKDGIEFIFEKNGSSFIKWEYSGPRKDHKLRVEIAKMESIVAIKLPQLRRYRRRSEITESTWVAVDQAKDTLFFGLAKSNVPEISLRIRAGSVDAPSITIRRLTVEPYRFMDQRWFVYVLTMTVGAMLLLPAFLSYATLGKNVQVKSTQILCSVPALVITFWFILYLLFLAISRLVDQSVTPLFMLGAYIGLNSLLVGWLLVGKKVRLLAELCLGTWQELVAYFMMLIIVCMVLVSHEILPLFDMAYTAIAGPKTFFGFMAHDPMFQYVNGLAIANLKPFSDYYGSSHMGYLFYQVQDREILVGAIYAPFRLMTTAVSAAIGTSYALYTIFGACLTALVIFPVLALARRFVDSRFIFFVTGAFLLNAVMLPNIYLTWFKLLGAGLIITGCIYLLDRGDRKLPWLYSGINWGIAANVHAGAVLCLPFIFPWLVYKNIDWTARSFFATILKALLLLASFVALLLPWALIKARYFPDQYALIREHFFPAKIDDGLLSSIKAFFANNDISEQLYTRLSRLRGTLREDELIDMANSLFSENTYEFLLGWNYYEFQFVIFLFIPTLVILGISWILSGRTPRGELAFVESNEIHDSYLQKKSNREPWILILISFISIAGVIFMTYGKHPPDLTYSLPLASIVIAHLMLVCIIIRFGKAGVIVYSLYLGFSAYRLWVWL